jgi:ERCC4-type nuclease
MQEVMEPAVGQVYEGTRQEKLYQILYIDNQVVLLRCEDAGHDGRSANRIERRVHFDSQLQSGFFEYKPDSNLDVLTESKQDWSEVSYIGEKTAENLHEAGYETAIDVHQAEDDELLEVDGLGAKGLANLREYSR